MEEYEVIQKHPDRLRREDKPRAQALPLQQLVDEACLLDAGRMLKPFYRKLWSPDNPTLGYCYIVSESFFHYRRPDLQPFVINLGDKGTHWFLSNKGMSEVVDPTGSQFASFDIRTFYPAARRCPFFKGSVPTTRGYISKHGQEMSRLLGFC